MTPQFTTPCFIRKNTPELRKKLERLGYKLNNGKWMGKYLATFRIKETKEWRYVASPEWDLQNNPDIDVSIDCGTNEDLFLAIAALRNDTDDYQWFVDATNFWFKRPALSLFPIAVPPHKATIEEIIQRFKK